MKINRSIRRKALARKMQRLRKRSDRESREYRYWEIEAELEYWEEIWNGLR